MLQQLATIFVYLQISLTVVFNLIFAVVSLREREYKAARISTILVVISLLLMAGVTLLGPLAVQICAMILVSVDLLMVILFFLPVGKLDEAVQTPENRIDERTIMFSRARLQPGTDNYDEYYEEHPEQLAGDDRIRKHPGLLVPNKTLNPALLSEISQTSFEVVDALRPLVDGEVAPEQMQIPFPKRGEFIRSLARHYGALDVGFTELKDYHIYSHIGRGPGVYGAPIKLDHTFAIAITVEMDAENVASSPAQPITMESSRQYLNVGTAAVQLAAAIRRMGFEARAHIDGSYRVICPLVARDAGLGEIGRMGLLMTPRQGPRVRLAVVTTTLPLPTAVYQPDRSLIDFCNICKKCADNCPSKAISFDERNVISGALRWQIDQQRCFDYWCRIGTDCGRCMSVCPYAHPDHWVHNMVRWGIRRSGVFRRFAYHADDFLYGRKVRRKPVPHWMQIALGDQKKADSDGSLKDMIDSFVRYNN